MPTARDGNPLRQRRVRLAAMLLPLGGSVLLCWGCAKDAAGPSSQLEPADFRAAAVVPGDGATGGEAAPVSAGAARPLPRRPIRMSASSEGTGVEGMSGGVLDVSVVPGPPRSTGPAPAASGEAVTLDSKVGEINGQPIIASKFLEPLDGRLRAVALKTAGNQAAWRAEAGSIILRSLEDQVLDQLVLAEAYAGLTPQMRDAGLRAFMAQIREELVRDNAGSGELANERVLEQEGLTLDQKSREELHKGMIREQLMRSIMPRVSVSSRDQLEYYERNFERFNPPGTAKLRLIWLAEGDAEGIAKVTAALETGEPFAEVAKIPTNRFLPEQGGEHNVRLTGAYEEGTFFGVAELNDAARALEPGKVVGPVTAPGSVAWLYLEGVDRPPGVSFYDAQLEIKQLLMEQELTNEQRRYFTQLMARGSFSNISETTNRLLGIATERYFIASAQ